MTRHMATKHTARLRIRRGTADEPQPRYQDFTLPFEAGTMTRHMATKHTARWRIRRGPADEPQPRYQDFTLPFEAGTTVLDALIAIRTQQEPSLAIRYSCINANVCKECL